MLAAKLFFEPLVHVPQGIEPVHERALLVGKCVNFLASLLELDLLLLEPSLHRAHVTNIRGSAFLALLTRFALFGQL